MTVYVDTGTLIDYLAQEAPGASILRSAQRRGRTTTKLFEDATEVLNRVATAHQGATSALTFYEIEEALYKQLVASTRGMPHARSARVLAARPIVAQALIAARLFGLEILEIEERTVASLAGHAGLVANAVRAADGLHIIRAIDFDADLVLATDAGLLALDGIFRNRRGIPMRCCDTNIAPTLL
jgi:hypothetical protein